MKHKLYEVGLRISPPASMDAERRYVLTEKEYAKGKLASAPRWGWKSLGVLDREDWRDYVRALNVYWHNMERFERETVSGLTMLKINIIYLGHEADNNVKVRMTVHNGAVLEHKTAPARPKRIDGAPEPAAKQKFKFALPNRFVRRGVKIRRHYVEAVFSRLAPGESALLLNQDIFIKTNEHTHLEVEIHSMKEPDFSCEF